MNLPVLSAAILGAAAVIAALQVPSPTQARATGAAQALVGEGLFASAAPIERWGGPVRADDVAAERLGRVTGVIASPDGTAQALVVAVGGLWGIGAREVEVGMDRVHLLPSTDGHARLVVDLSIAEQALAAPPKLSTSPALSS